MSNLSVYSNQELQSTNQTKALQLKETLLGLVKFDSQYIDTAKVIYFSKTRSIYWVSG